jgi:hypothetical protein
VLFASFLLFRFISPLERRWLLVNSWLAAGWLASGYITNFYMNLFGENQFALAGDLERVFGTFMLNYYSRMTGKKLGAVEPTRCPGICCTAAFTRCSRIYYLIHNE